jgi:hypothetical protein
MTDSSPTTEPEGQEPEAPEGQEPAAGDAVPTEGQEPDSGKTYTEAYVKQLRRENAGLRNRGSELEEKLTEFEDRDKSEMQRLQERAAESEQRASDSDLRLLRYEVAAEHGLDLDAAKFLTGSTREELELRAEELSTLIADKGRPSAGSFDGGARRPVPDERSPEEAHNDLILRSIGHTAGRG